MDGAAAGAAEAVVRVASPRPEVRTAVQAHTRARIIICARIPRHHPDTHRCDARHRLTGRSRAPRAGLATAFSNGRAVTHARESPPRRDDTADVGTATNTRPFRRDDGREPHRTERRRHRVFDRRTS
jgi:hypothetical protein